LLLVIAIATPPIGATALSAIVPVTGEPATAVVAATLTLTSVAVVVGEVVEEEPHAAAKTDARHTHRRFIPDSGAAAWQSLGILNSTTRAKGALSSKFLAA
jgi:hypothetical protein